MSIFHPYISYFAQVDFRTDKRVFGLLQEDRIRGGMYILGKTGTGKTNLIQSLCYQDVASTQRGICVLDIHGQLSKNIIQNLPTHRKKDLVYLDTSDFNLSLGYNPLKKVGYHYRHLIASHITEAIEKMNSGSSWGSKIQYILTQSLNVLLDQEQASFEDLYDLLTDPLYQAKCAGKVIAKNTKNFLLKELPKYTKADIQPVLSKVAAFMSSPILKKILVENKEQISISDIVNNGKILIVNISKGMLGTHASHLLGSLILSSIASVGFARMKYQHNMPFYVYCDEAHFFTTDSLANGFSELRKANISYVIGHQYLNQLTPTIRDAILGNFSNILVFRCSYQDATYFSKLFNKVFVAEDFVNLPNYHCYLTMLISGRPCRAFSAKTLPSAVFQYPK